MYVIILGADKYFYFYTICMQRGIEPSYIR